MYLERSHIPCIKRVLQPMGSIKFPQDLHYLRNFLRNFQLIGGLHNSSPQFSCVEKGSILEG